MRIRHHGPTEEKIELQMTPMIDIVFQLLIFFIMSFKIVTLEGDFNVKMPLGAPSEGPPPDSLPPIRVQLTANDDGTLSGIRMGERPLPGFQALRREIVTIVGPEGGPGSLAEEAEVEFDLDYDLDYKYVIDAITAVSGYLDPDSGRIIRLIEKIKFSPPEEPSG